MREQAGEQKQEPAQVLVQAAAEYCTRRYEERSVRAAAGNDRRWRAESPAGRSVRQIVLPRRFRQLADDRQKSAVAAGQKIENWA